MLVKFEQVDGQEIWINPALVDSVGYRMEVDIDACQFVSQVVAGWVEIGMAGDSSRGYVVLGTPEEVVAKLFPQTRMPGEKFYVPV
jgi:hypothetical protein